MSNSPSESRRTAALTVFYLLVGVVVLWVLFLIREVLLVLYVAGLLAIGFGPVVQWLERHAMNRRRIPRWAAILVLYTLLLGTVAAVLFAVIPPLVAQAADLSKNLPAYVDQAQDQLARWGLISHRYTWSELLRNGSPGVAISSVLGAVQGAMSVVAVTVTLLVLPYYLLLEAHSLQLAFVRLFPRDRRAQVTRITRSVAVKVSAWLSGQLLLSVVIGTSAAVGLWLLGVPYFYVLALIAGIGELIPIVGPILSAIPAILVALTVSPQIALFTGLYFLVQQFAENHLLVPRVMSRQVGVSPVTVMVSLLIGSELLGIGGALLAVPTAAIVQVLIQEFVDNER